MPSFPEALESQHVLNRRKVLRPLLLLLALPFLMRETLEKSSNCFRLWSSHLPSQSAKAEVTNYKEKNQFPIICCIMSSKYKPLVAAFLVLSPSVQVLVYSPITVQSFPPLNTRIYLLKNKPTTSKNHNHHLQYK